ncbi:MAG: hypothetical protein ACTSU3_08890 [Candidatus Thorarchaeota archaeon]
MKQDKLDKHNIDDSKGRKKVEYTPSEKPESTRMISINVSDFKTHPLWNILVETARRSPLYSGLAGYIRDQILPNNPNIEPRELASKLAISVGEAMVILDASRLK